jgi:hypothetical protein
MEIKHDERLEGIENILRYQVLRDILIDKGFTDTDDLRKRYLEKVNTIAPESDRKLLRFRETHEIE